MFVSILMLNIHFQMQFLLAFERLNDKVCVYTEVMAQDDTVTLEKKHASFSAFNYV